MSDSRRTYEILDTDTTEPRFKQALSDLFDGDGTIYLVSGYFTKQGYLSLKEEIESFLDRSPDNTLKVVVGSTSDQLSPGIARDLWRMDDRGQVEIYKRPKGLHAKLYLRMGPEPECILGSANITRVAFEYNTELSLRLDGGSDHDLEPLQDWVDALIQDSEKLRARDVSAPALVIGSALNWSNKARLLPVSHVALRATPILLLLSLLGVLLLFVVGAITSMF